MLRFALRNILDRPLRNGLTVVGLAAAVAALVGISAFGHGYQRALQSELDRMGLQLMLVPLGCPYDAAARVIKGKALESSLPEAALAEVRRDPAVAVAAPLFLATGPRPTAGRVDMWVGLDETALALKPWWRVHAGSNWFTCTNSVILGCDAAELELRAPGDALFSPETCQEFRVAGVLERSGTSDDSLFFVPLGTAQRMFGATGRLTAIAIRLRDPAQLAAVCQRLQAIPGAQVVTLTEMMGTFLNLLGAVRTLLLSLGAIAIAVSVLSVFNTLLAAVIERAPELCVMRALGASPAQVAGLLAAEALLLAGAGSAAGTALALMGGRSIESIVKAALPLAPNGSLWCLTAPMLCQTMALGMLVAVLGGVYPAWRASRLPPAGALRGEC